MIDFKPIKLKDKPLFDKFFSKTSYQNSEKNFSNLFIWRDTYEYEYGVYDDTLFVRGKSRENKKPFYHFPYGDGDISWLVENENVIFNPVLEDMKNNLTKYDYKFKENRDAFDYIYKSEKLINLKGSNLRNKRRWIKKFKDNYDHTYETIDKTNIDEARKFTLNLIKDNPNETNAMNEMFNNFQKLGIEGCIIRVNGEIIGVSTGEELTPNTVLIHCERCNRNYEGIYNVINQEFVKNQWADYTYINREQDLGIKGLRQAKMTYRPDILLKKYIAKRI